MKMKKSTKGKLLAIVLLFVVTSGLIGAHAVDDPGVVWPNPGRRATISSSFKDSSLTVGISSRTAGAIDSITWKGKEFVNSSDHGREFQSASSYEGKGECFNPTEAGSHADGVGDTSSSKLLSLRVSDRLLETKTQMAYWIGRGGKTKNCRGSVSTVEAPLAKDTLSKKVSIGSFGIPNVIEYVATFNVSEPRTIGRFEALTGYMPSEFSRFSTFDPVSGRAAPLSDGPGDQPLPVIFSTEDGEFALGVYSPKLKDAATVGPSYGRFRFAQTAFPTTKWNCFFRKQSVPAGDNQFSCFVVVGSIDDVQRGLQKLDQHYNQDPGAHLPP